MLIALTFTEYPLTSARAAGICHPRRQTPTEHRPPRGFDDNRPRLKSYLTPACNFWHAQSRRELPEIVFAEVTMAKGMKSGGKEPGRVELTGPAGIREAEQIRSSLLEAVRQHSRAIVNCAGVTSIDISTIQLILSARKTAAAAGKSLTLAHPASDGLLDTLQHAGMVNPKGSKPAPDQTFWLK
jgi:hypothetical protein